MAQKLQDIVLWIVGALVVNKFIWRPYLYPAIFHKQPDPETIIPGWL